MLNVTPQTPALYNNFANRHGEQSEARNCPRYNTGITPHAPGLGRGSDMWRVPHLSLDGNRSNIVGRFNNLNTVQPQNSSMNQSLVSAMSQLSNVLTTMLKNLKPDSSVVPDTSKVGTEKSHFGKLLSNALSTITPAEQQLFNKLDNEVVSRLDPCKPLTPQERVAVEKFAVIERELEKKLSKHPSEYTQRTVPIDTTDLETILTHEGYPTRRESEVIAKLYEGKALTLEDQIIALKVNMLGY